MAEKRTTYKLQDVGGIGEVNIADEVVTVIAGLAATEVEGVASMGGNITNELVSKLGVKNLSKGVKVTVLEGNSLKICSLCSLLRMIPPKPISLTGLL